MTSHQTRRLDRDQQVAGVRNLFDLVASDHDNVAVSFLWPTADGLVEAVGAAPRPV